MPARPPHPHHLTRPARTNGNVVNIQNNTEVIQHTGPSYFERANGNISINGSTFTNIAGDHHVHVDNSKTPPGAESLYILSPTVAHNAMFDSAERYARGKCHPGTREKVIATILKWIEDPDPFGEQSVFWMHGSAGVGKSAIMQTVAETLYNNHRERYGGSFFFANGVAGRKDGNSLFRTLAYQMAENFGNTVGRCLDEVLAKSPGLPYKSMDIQIKSLLIDPVIQSKGAFISSPPVLLIDGLDECDTSAAQRQILSEIGRAMKNHSHSLPLRFLIASRPEYWIRDLFHQPTLSRTTIRLSLNETSFEATEDIGNYLLDEFDKIYAQKAKYMGNVKRPWPAEDTFRRLVWDASGQFVYATTVIRYVGYSSDTCNPAEQLDSITSPGPERNIALAPIDALYQRILSSYKRPIAPLKLILGGLLLDMHISDIEIYLGVSSSEIQIALDFLAPVMNVISQPEHNVSDDVEDVFRDFEDKYARVHHLSFKEFLGDSQRSGAFYIDTNVLNGIIRDSYFKIIQDIIIGNVISNHFQISDPSESLYRISFIICRAHQTLIPPIDKSFQDMVDQLRGTTALASKIRGSPHPRSLGMIILIYHLEWLVHAIQHCIPGRHDLAMSFREVIHKAVYPRAVREILASEGHQLLNAVQTAFFAVWQCTSSEASEVGMPPFSCLYGPALDEIYLICGSDGTNRYLRVNRHLIARRKQTDHRPLYALIPAMEGYIEQDMIGNSAVSTSFRCQIFQVIWLCLRFVLRLYMEEKEHLDMKEPHVHHLFYRLCPDQFRWFSLKHNISDIREQDIRNDQAPILSTISEIVDISYKALSIFYVKGVHSWRFMAIPKLFDEIVEWNGRQLERPNVMAMITNRDKYLADTMLKIRTLYTTQSPPKPGVPKPNPTIIISRST